MNLDPVAEIAREADRCVMCGMCLPHCPTYGLTGLEAESPRGRIALVRGLAADQLPRSDALVRHLDHCLGCRACEAICPSGVHYGRIIDLGRRVVARGGRPGGPVPALLRTLVTKPPLVAGLGHLLALYRRTGVQRLARASRLFRATALGSAEALLPETAGYEQPRTYYPPVGTARGRVALFSGCLARSLDLPVRAAAIALLTRCGYHLEVPDDQVCCGALHLHAGDTERAAALARRNREAFGRLQVDAIITTASGCGALLAEYGDHPALADGNGRAALPAPVVDISHWLSTHAALDTLSLRPLRKRVAVHDPCSLRNVQRQQQGPYRLLRAIPEIDLFALPDNGRCCGSAGAYLLEHPETAEALAAAKVQATLASQADIVVTSNFGCALHLRRALQSRQCPVAVLHPVELLARQLDPEPVPR